MKFKHVFMYLSLVLLTACGGSNGASSNPNNTNTATNAAAKPSVSIGYVAAIPVVNSTGQATNAVVTNNVGSQLTLTSYAVQIVNQQSNTAGSADSYYDVSLCKTLPVNGQCSLLLKPQSVANRANPVSYLIQLTYTDNNGQSYAASELISYNVVGVTSTANYYISTNRINAVVGSGQVSTITVPFVLGQTYTPGSVKAVSSIPVQSIQTACSSYTANSACNIFITVKGSGGTVSPQISLSGTLATQNNAVKAMGAFSNTVSFALTVTSNVIANILNSSNVYIVQSESNVAGSTSVTLFNSGLTSASGIQVTSANKAVIFGTQCNGSLPAGTQCTFTINLNSSQNTYFTVNLSYNNGQAGVQSVFGVNYYANSGSVSPGLFIDSTNLNTFNGVAIQPATAYSMTIPVTNNGNVPLTDLQIGDITNVDKNITVDSATTCQAGQSLNVESGCNMVYDYMPTAPETQNVSLYIGGNYTTPQGQTVTYSSGVIAIPVKALAQASITMTPSTGTVAVLADNESSATFSITAKNVGGVDAQSAVFSYLTAPGVTNLNKDNPSGCSNGGKSTTLVAGASCTVNYKFGPLSQNVSGQYTESVSYLAAPGVPATASGSVQLEASTAALVIVQSITTNQSSESWTFINTSPSAFQVTITYQNIGAADAESFNVNTNNSTGNGYLVDGNSSCASGTDANYVLTTNKPCTIILDAVNGNQGTSAWSYQSYPGSISIYGQIPGFSYNDTNTGVNQVESPIFNSSNALTTAVATPPIILNITDASNGASGNYYYAQLTVNNAGPGTLNSINFSLPSGVSTGGNVTCPMDGYANSPVDQGASCTISLKSGIAAPTSYYIPYTYTSSNTGSTLLSGVESVEMSN